MRGVLAGGLLMAMTVVAVSVQADETVVAKGKKVKLDYTLTVNNETVETTKGKEPLQYTQGQEMLIPGLEKGLEGMKTGESRKIAVTAEQGYGAVNPQMVREFETAKLPKDLVPKVGLVLEMQDAQGNAFPCTITEVKEKSVMLDFNHPLAGQNLAFDVTVLGIE